jgi:predicted dehydrogenase
LQEEFFLRFAEFEEMVKEHERARAIFQVGVNRRSQRECAAGNC